MIILGLGLIIFLGVHSSRMLAAPMRARVIAERGENTWKAIYSVLSLVGLVLIVIGYRASPEVFIWIPPVWLRHVSFVLTAIAFVLIAAAYVPGNRIRDAVGHPMAAAVKLWAFAHLLANGTLASMLLFASFLVWAILNYNLSRRRDRRAGVDATSGDVGVMPTIATVVLGLVLWVAFAVWLHRALIGVSPIVSGGTAG